jgi:hypothetical protein
MSNRRGYMNFDANEEESINTESLSFIVKKKYMHDHENISADGFFMEVKGDLITLDYCRGIDLVIDGFGAMGGIEVRK